MRHSNQLIIDIANLELFYTYLLGSLTVAKLKYEQNSKKLVLLPC